MDSSPSWVQGVRAKESEHAEGGAAGFMGRQIARGGGEEGKGGSMED